MRSCSAPRRGVPAPLGRSDQDLGVPGMDTAVRSRAGGGSALLCRITAPEPAASAAGAAGFAHAAA